MSRTEAFHHHSAYLVNGRIVLVIHTNLRIRQTSESSVIALIHKVHFILKHKFEQRAIKATEELEAQKATEVKKAKKAKKTS